MLFQPVLRSASNDINLLSEGESVLIRSEVTDVDANALGVEKKESESKSWKMNKDPFVIKTTAGEEVLQLSDMKFTVIRYEISDAPYKSCFITFRAKWSPFKHQSVDTARRPEFKRFELEATTDHDGGTVLSTDYSGLVRCNNLSFLEVKKKNIKPDLYDVINGCRLTPRISYWLRC